MVEMPVSYDNRARAQIPRRKRRFNLARRRRVNHNRGFLVRGDNVTIRRKRSQRKSCYLVHKFRLSMRF